MNDQLNKILKSMSRICNAMHGNNNNNPKKWEKIMRNHKKIRVCGQYACGSSSLIQAACKDGTVPDEAINPIRENENDLSPLLYKTEAVDFSDNPGMQLGDEAYEYHDMLQIYEENYSPGGCNWYCMDGAKASIQLGDKDMLDIFKKNTIAVITRSDLMPKEKVEKMISDLEEFIPRERIVITSVKKKLGLNRLLAVSKKILYGDSKNNMTTKWDKYFAHQKDWIKNAGESAEECILTGAAKAFAISTVTPIPNEYEFLMPLVSNQLHMLHRIGTCYGYPVDHNLLLFFYNSIAGNEVHDFSFVADLSSNSSINTAKIYAEGRTLKAYLESNMTLDIKELNEIFDATKEESRKIDWKAP